MFYNKFMRSDRPFLYVITWDPDKILSFILNSVIKKGGYTFTRKRFKKREVDPLRGLVDHPTDAMSEATTHR
jgi:hypothetical protein